MQVGGGNKNKPVEMGNGDDLPPNVVVESVDGISVDEAVSNPQSCLHNLLDFTYVLKEVTLIGRAQNGANRSMFSKLHKTAPRPTSLKTSWIPSSEINSGFSFASSILDCWNFRMKKDSSEVIATRSPLSDQNTCKY